MRLIAASLVLLLVAVPAFAQPVTRPDRGSPVRAAVLDALREAAARAPYAPTRRDVVFTDVDLRIVGDWAFVNATPTLPGGRASDHCTRAEPDEPGDSNVTALMVRSGSRWSVVEQGTCATDVWYAGAAWNGRFGAPVALDPTQILAVRFPAAATTFSDGDGFLSLRSEPSASRGQRLQRMPDGSSVSVQRCGALERVDGDWGRWCRVRAGRQDGWAFSHYLQF